MPKGRKTDLNERIQIVLFCLQNDNNYQLTADSYQVYTNKYTNGLKNMMLVMKHRCKIIVDEIKLCMNEQWKNN